LTKPVSAALARPDLAGLTDTIFACFVPEPVALLQAEQKKMAVINTSKELAVCELLKRIMVLSGNWGFTFTDKNSFTGRIAQSYLNRTQNEMQAWLIINALSQHGNIEKIRYIECI